MYGSFTNIYKITFFSLNEFTISPTCTPYILILLATLQLFTGRTWNPVKYHLPDDINQPAISASDSKISVGDQIFSNSDRLKYYAHFSSEEDGEIFPLSSDDEVQLAVP